MDIFKCTTKWDVLVATIVILHVLMAPYTKVEESFNIQAIHDLLYHRHHLEKYDHFQFPGVVPRTFIGAIIVSFLSSPFVMVANKLELSKIYVLIIVRLTLGSLLLGSFVLLRFEISKKFGRQVAFVYTLISTVQFHLLFYITRPLPNVLALAPVNFAYALWMSTKYKSALKCLVFAAAVFRCDVLLLLGPIGLSLLLKKEIHPWAAIKWCTTAALLSIGLTIMVDSVLWQRLLWPEMEVFWFNSVLNRSSEWGVSPIHWYFSSALPRAMLGAFPLCFVGLALDQRLSQYMIPILSFVVIYSKLPHKELRFILFAVPMLNVSAAVAVMRIYNNRHKGLWMFAFFGCLCLLLASAAFTVISSTASYANYPGGHALHILHERGFPLSDVPSCTVHIDALPAMTGISRFCEKGPPWRYSKEENISIMDLNSQNFTYLVSGESSITGFKCLVSVEGFSRAVFQFSLPPVKLVMKPMVFIHGKTDSPLVDESQWPGCALNSLENKMTE